MWTPEAILQVLDKCCEAYTFPMLDNGYVYLAATRLSLHRSDVDWALVIEVFGFSPRAGLPDLHVYSFGSRLHARNEEDGYASREAYESYLANNPHNESRFFSPIDEGAWQDEEDSDFVAEGATEVVLRGRRVAIGSPSTFAEHGIELEEPPRIMTHELCRLLAALHRDDVLATPTERRVSVPPELREILVLEAWHHPDVVNDERPSQTEAFEQLARVLSTGDLGAYGPSAPANTHWVHWPDGGSL